MRTRPAIVEETWYAVEDNLSRVSQLASEVFYYRQSAERERDAYYPGCNIVEVKIRYKPSGKVFRTNRSKVAT